MQKTGRDKKRTNEQKTTLTPKSRPKSLCCAEGCGVCGPDQVSTDAGAQEPEVWHHWQPGPLNRAGLNVGFTPPDVDKSVTATGRRTRCAC